jgi:endonuclease III
VKVVDERTDEIRRKLIQLAETRMRRRQDRISFTRDARADALVLDLDRHPHAFVLGCVMDRHVKAEKAWRIPYELKLRFGAFTFRKLDQ